MPLRTGVIGAGTVSENNHLPAVRRNPRTTLATICDADGERARAAAAEYGGRPYEDAAAMLSEAALDWVHVATPVQTHLDLATAAIEAGVPVTVQKPATVTLAELEELLATAQRTGVPASVVHNWLYYPVVRRVRRRVADGELGPVRAVETTFAGEGRPDETYRGSWVFDLPGGDFEEGMPHPLYLTLALGGPPRSEDDVNAVARTAGTYDRDVAYDGTALQYVGESGALCSVTFLSGSARDSAVRVYGERGSLTLDVPSMRVTVHDADDGPYHFFEERLRRNARDLRAAAEGAASNLRRRAEERIEERFDRHRTESVDGHYYLFDEAARALERGDQPPVPLERSRWTLAMMEAVREAASAEPEIAQ